MKMRIGIALLGRGSAAVAHLATDAYNGLALPSRSALLLAKAHRDPAVWHCGQILAKDRALASSSRHPLT
jgi:hypothetical protein